jgi:hypothetical protein
MSNIEQDWNKLMDQWQHEEPRPDTKTKREHQEKKHIKTLANKVKEDSKIARINMIFSAGMSLLLCIYLFNEIRLGLPSKFDYALYYTMSVLFAMVGVLSVWHNKSTWKSHAEHTVEYIQLMLRQNLAASKVSQVAEIFSFGVLLTFYGIVLWIFAPSLLAGTLMTDLNAIAKPMLGSIILLSVTVIGIAGIFLSRKQQRSLSQKAQLLRGLIRDFQ